jgi:cytidine deaminase
MNKELHFSYETLKSISELNESDRIIAEQAIEAMGKAYAPYSKFNVGAALKLKTGEIIQGNNQENMAFPSGLCAERVALFYAGAKYPGVEIETLCIVAKGDLVPKSQILSPCGSCRQVMLESENRQKNPIRVILINQDGTVLIVNSAKDFLPFGFGK